MNTESRLAAKVLGLRKKMIPKASDKLTQALRRFPLELSGNLPILALENSRPEFDAASTVHYATALSAGFDLKAADDVTIPAGEWRLIDTGLRLKPQANPPCLRIRVGRAGFDVVAELQIRPRSGLAAKRGLTVLNAPGTIDADYEGKIMTCLMNHGPEAFVVRQGDKVSQGVFALAVRPHSVKVDEKVRGAGGFGSTGQ